MLPLVKSRPPSQAAAFCHVDTCASSASFGRRPCLHPSMPSSAPVNRPPAQTCRAIAYHGITLAGIFIMLWGLQGYVSCMHLLKMLRITMRMPVQTLLRINSVTKARRSDQPAKYYQTDCTYGFPCFLQQEDDTLSSADFCLRTVFDQLARLR